MLCIQNGSESKKRDAQTHITLFSILLYFSASLSLRVTLVVFQKMTEVKGGGTHYRTRPLTI